MEREKELAEMTGSLEQLAGLEAKVEEESESSVRGSENFIKGAIAFKHKKCILERTVFNCIEVWPKGVGQLSCSRGGRDGGVWWEGRCVGVVKVCETVLEMGQLGGMCNVSSCTALTVCHNRPLLCTVCVYIYLQLTLNVIRQARCRPF